MIASNRRHMADMLDDRMRRSRKLAPADPDKGQVKSYMVEANFPEESTPLKTKKFIESLFPKMDEKHVSDLVLSPAKNDTLISIQAKVSGSAITAYLDFTNPRFWLFHSMSESKKLDWLVARWVSHLPDLDRVWLPTPFLEKCMEFGSLRGIGLDYDRQWLTGSDQDNSGVDVLKMQLRGRQAAHLRGIMRENDAAPHETPLSRVTIRVNGGSVVDDIKFDGKVTGRGKSFDEHLALTTNLYERYARQIRRIERDFAIHGETKNQRFRIEGEPITFVFENPIEQMKKFCEAMFSATEPFRLWGLPVRQSEDYYSVEALDLHSGKAISFELTPKMIRAYLPQGSCGNSILRFYTNLQHRFDALVKVVSSSGDPVFEF